MATAGGPKIVTTGLKFYIDSSNVKSYISGSTKWFDLIQKVYHMDINAGETVNTTLANAPVLFFDGQQGSYTTWSGPQLTSPGIFDQSSFSYIVIAYASSLNGPDAGDYARAIETGGYPNSYFISQWNSGSKNISFSGEDDNQQTFSIGTGTNSIDIDQWYFFAGVLDREASKERTYLNGSLQVEESLTAGFQGMNPTGSFRIPSSYNEYPGAIALTMLYERALTSQEILQNYNALKERFSL